MAGATQIVGPFSKLGGSESTKIVVAPILIHPLSTVERSKLTHSEIIPNLLTSINDGPHHDVACSFSNVCCISTRNCAINSAAGNARAWGAPCPAH